MLELDNLAFDYGLTAGVKAEIEADFKVELGPSQLHLLNTSRRWHVIAFTAFLITIVITLPMLPSLWARMRVMSLCLIVIIAIGEAIEIYLRWPMRSLQGNSQRLCMFLIKVVIAIVIKWYIVEALAYLAQGSSPLD